MCPSASELLVASDETTAAVPTSVPSCVPADPVSQAAYSYAASHLHPLILAHSTRVYLYARALATREASPWLTPTQLPLLFTACILHDIGTVALHDGPQRFEVEGADAAASFLREYGVADSDLMHDVWVAIAVHTSPGIAERIAPLARLVRLGVKLDFRVSGSEGLVSMEEVKVVEGEFPRGKIEKVLGDTVVDQAVRNPDKAPAASWPGVLLRAKRDEPEWTGVNKGF